LTNLLLDLLESFSSLGFRKNIFIKSFLPIA
jgi:hypothetical protein